LILALILQSSGVEVDPWQDRCVMPGHSPAPAALLLLAGALAAGCTDREPPADSTSILGPWRWVGSFGGIAGIRPTPDAEGYERILYFHRDGRLTIYEGDSVRAQVGYRIAPLRDSAGAPPSTGLHYDDTLPGFPFAPGVEKQVVRRSGRDTLILEDPCCFRYEHAFVRIE
jgi:hypothetical protein